MNRTLTAWIVSLVLLTGACRPAGAIDDTRFAGQPAFGAGQTRRFVIWEDAGVFKLRTTTEMVLNRFSGAIFAVRGTFTDVRAIRLDKGDYVRVSDDRKRIFFSFTTRKGVDGLNFTTDAERLAFNLHINRRKAAKLLEVFLGKDGRHPLNNPFLCFIRGGRGDDDNAASGTGIESAAEEGQEVTAVVPEAELEPESRASD